MMSTANGRASGYKLDPAFTVKPTRAPGHATTIDQPGSETFVKAAHGLKSTIGPGT